MNLVQSVHQKGKLTIVARNGLTSDNRGLLSMSMEGEKKVMGEDQDNQYKKTE